MELAESYDSLPYPSKFFAKTHPDALGTLAKLFGMNPEQPENCRVLELGCGNGSNLLSHAFNLPNANFVGVDISAEHIKQAKKWADELNLQNVEFHEIDLMKMSAEDFGEFGYIVGHGLISWIPDFVIEKVFEICKEMFAPNGVGYLSYNAFPGSHYRNMVREIMRFDTKEIDDPMSKVQRSISFLSMLSEHAREKKVFQPILDFELKRHFEREASDIFHDDLSDCYKPFYFHEFASMLDENDLQYLCESELFAMSVKNFPAEVQEFFKNKTDIIEREQYIDFFLGRIFRQTLFCRKDVELKRDFEPTSLDEFLIASAIKPVSKDADLIIQKIEKFVGQQDFGIEIDHPPTKIALKYLGENWAKAIPFAKLLKTVKQKLEASEFATENWEKEFGIMRAIIFQLVQATDLIKLHLYQPNAVQEVSETPKINDLARWQINGETNSVTTLFGINIEIEDKISRHLLTLLDGTRNHEKLLEDLKSFIETNDDIEKNLSNSIEDWLENSLRELGKLGLFVS